MSDNEFTQLYLKYKDTMERYIHYKVSNYTDAEDIIQDVITSAYTSFDKLYDVSQFKQWIIGIATHKCVDYYNKKARKLEIPFDIINGNLFDRHGREDFSLVEDTLNKLSDKNKQILYLFYIKGFSQNDISQRLNIPLGTVKSRVNTAKRKFKDIYPYYKEILKGSDSMKKFPEFMPSLAIEKSKEKPFSVRFEEIAGWLITPRVGEKASFAFYDDPQRKLTSVNEMECVRNAEIHGIPCVQVNVIEKEDNKTNERTLFLRMTETHCMYIAEMSIRNGTMYFGSFMDEEWCKRYEIGENNCGREIYQEQKGIITVSNEGDLLASQEKVPDIIGRYTITINNKQYDTIALVSLEEGILVIQYIDKNGKTILFRRYNKDDWKLERYKEKWTEKFPDSVKLKVNNDTYVHWYDCISDYVI